jgi:hypothetical protein
MASQGEERASMAAAQPCAEDQYCTLIRESTEDAAAATWIILGTFYFILFLLIIHEIYCTRNNTHGHFTQPRDRENEWEKRS